MISEWGRKAIIVKPNDEVTYEKPFGHALIASIDRYPRIVTKRMSKKKVKQRSKIMDAHSLQCRHSLDKDKLNKEVLKDPMKKKKARHIVRTKFIFICCFFIGAAHGFEPQCSDEEPELCQIYKSEVHNEGDMFNCRDAKKQCIPKRWTCDGFVDCPNKFDEIGCLLPGIIISFVIFYLELKLIWKWSFLSRKVDV